MAIFRNGIIAPFLMQANFGKLFFTESLAGLVYNGERSAWECGF